MKPGTIEYLHNFDLHLTIVSNPAAQWFSYLYSGKAFPSQSTAAYYRHGKQEFDLLARGLISAVRSLAPTRCEEVRQHMGRKNFRIRVSSVRRGFINQLTRFQAGLQLDEISPVLVSFLAKEVATRKIDFDPVYIDGVSKKVRYALSFAYRTLTFDPDPYIEDIKTGTYQIPDSVLDEDVMGLTLPIEGDAAQSAA